MQFTATLLLVFRCVFRPLQLSALVNCSGPLFSTFHLYFCYEYVLQCSKNNDMHLVHTVVNFLIFYMSNYLYAWKRTPAEDIVLLILMVAILVYFTLIFISRVIFLKLVYICRISFYVIALLMQYNWFHLHLFVSKFLLYCKCKCIFFNSHADHIA